MQTTRTRGAISIGYFAWVQCLVLAGSGFALADDALFEVREFASSGRSVSAELGDFDGDGQTDLFIVRLTGIPPEEERIVSVYLQRDGRLPETPSHSVALPRWSAVYEVADVVDAPGEELVLLRPDGVTLLSLAGPDALRRDLRVPGPSTVSVSEDERGFEPFPLVYRDFGPTPWILVPQLGQVTAITATGDVQAQLELGRRANYYVTPIGGLVSVESNLQVFFDHPKLAVGDVDGDGRVDIATSTRHELRVFLRREDGSYPTAPDRSLPLERVTPRDHIRGSGGVISDFEDLDGDGRLDLVVSHIQGAITDATTTTYTYMNRGGWNLAEPDATFHSAGAVGSNITTDFDGDGRRELLHIRVRFSLLELVELLLTQEIDTEFALYPLSDPGGYGGKPTRTKKFSVPFSFDTFRPKGFMPVIDADLNRDGRLDFIASRGGEAIEIYLGDKGAPFGKPSGRQKMDTRGVVRFGDVDSDGLTDLVLFDPHQFDTPVRLARNLGQLPGTSPSLKSAATRPR